MNPILQTIKTAERILVTAHTDPDGDAVGSLLAMGLALERLGKRTTLYNESPIPAVYQFLPAVGRVEEGNRGDHRRCTLSGVVPRRRAGGALRECR